MPPYESRKPSDADEKNYEALKDALIDLVIDKATQRQGARIKEEIVADVTRRVEQSSDALPRDIASLRATQDKILKAIQALSLAPDQLQSIVNRLPISTDKIASSLTRIEDALRRTTPLVYPMEGANPSYITENTPQFGKWAIRLGAAFVILIVGIAAGAIWGGLQTTLFSSPHLATTTLPASRPPVPETQPEPSIPRQQPSPASIVDVTSQPRRSREFFENLLSISVKSCPGGGAPARAGAMTIATCVCGERIASCSTEIVDDLQGTYLALLLQGALVIATGDNSISRDGVLGDKTNEAFSKLGACKLGNRNLKKAPDELVRETLHDILSYCTVGR